MIKLYVRLDMVDHGRNMVRLNMVDHGQTMFWQWCPFNVGVWNMVGHIP